MKKMPCLFQRDFTDKRRPVLLRDVTLGCEWVLAGEGVATRKRDGTACAVIGGRLFKRYDVKLKDGTYELMLGRLKAMNVEYVACDDPDPVTGHWPHWILVGQEPESRWHREAWELVNRSRADGTYELCGPKLQGNPEGCVAHVFFPHGREAVEGLPDPLTWEGLKTFLAAYQGEGIVFHHPDGRMCKIRRDDYGFSWPIREAS